MNHQKGDIAVYIALLVLGVTLSSSLLFTLILTKQLKSTEEAVSSERAFYAASSGLEQGLYNITTFPYDTSVSIQDRFLANYADTNDIATYTVNGKVVGTVNDAQVLCMEAKGEFHSLARNIKLGPKDCAPQ